MDSPNVTLGLLIGLGSYTCLYVGKGIQKLAIEGIKAKRSLRSKYSGVWIAGTVLTALPVFIQWAALIYAPVHIIAPLEGIGLIILLSFSFCILKEKIVSLEIVSVLLIAAGVGAIAYFHRETDKIAIEDISLLLLFVCMLPLLGLEAMATLLSRKFDYRFGGLIIGFSAGTCMAFQTLAKRISLIPEFRFLAVCLTLIFAILTLVLTQFGFAKAQANRVVPAFTSGSILVATILGAVVLNEEIVPLQIIGLVILIAGILGLSAFKKDTPAP